MAKIFSLSNGRQLSYDMSGHPNPTPGKTVVYWHGYMSSRLEAKLLEEAAVAAGVTFIAVDRAGYGDSTHDPLRTPESAAKDMDEFLDHVLPSPTEKVIFFGVSGGSPYAAACAALLSHRTQALLLNVPFAPVAGREEELCAAISPQTQRMLVNTVERPSLLWATLYLASLLQRTPLRHYLLRLGGFSEADQLTAANFPEKMKALSAAGREGNKRSLLGQFRDLEVMAAHSFDWEMLKNISCPTVVWAGGLDATCPIVMAEAYTAVIPNATLRVVPDMGHFLGMRHGQEMLDSIL